MKQLIFITFLAFTNILIAQNPCLSTQDFTIVVLGSSTAAGAGASQSDSAWVNRYRNTIKQINPNNEVINLAVGGFTTYKLMPNSHQPNPGRPLPDTSKNITKALTYNPDAIIINLPSNDIASGFPINEQIFNFDSLVSFSNNSGIPIWICTTQPKNMSISNMQLQVDMRDTIYAHFSPNVLDFWTNLATSTNGLSPIYDSGDGTHLNDAGHGLLANRVLQKDILSSLYVPPIQLDYTIVDILNNSPICGDSLANFDIITANIGNATTNNYNLTIEVQHILTNGTLGGITMNTFTNFSPLNTCESDTFTVNIDTRQEGDYIVKATVNANNDFDITNNETIISFTSLGLPDAILASDTSCNLGSVLLEAIYAPNDTAFWYNSMQGGNPIGFGTTFLTPSLSTTTDFYVEIVRGDLFYKDEITTTLNSSINWNGTMFDIAGLTDLTIDSFGVKIANLGLQGIDIYYKNGSHIGAETNASAWTFLGTTTVNVTDNTKLTTVPLGNLQVTMNNTYGIYIQLSNANAQLSYQWQSNPVTRSNSELSITTGSGISHNFSGTYYPRDWNGTIYYHHGLKPQGDCSTGLLPVTATVSSPDLNIGTDTIIDIYSTLDLSAVGFDDYLWSNGSTSAQTTFFAQGLGVGIHYISLEAIDSLGCLASDTIVLGIADLVRTERIVDEYDIDIFPNPFEHRITINLDRINSLEATEVTVYNSFGKEVHRQIFNDLNFNIDAANFASGIYFIRVKSDSLIYSTKVIKE